jgi:hypothetical protein
MCGLALTIYAVVVLADKMDKNYVETKTNQESRNLHTDTFQPVSLGKGSHDQEATTATSPERGERK